MKVISIAARERESKRLPAEFRQLDTQRIRRALGHGLRFNLTAVALTEAIEFLREVLSSPYSGVTVVLPAVPVDGDNRPPHRMFRPPGSPAEKVILEAPPTMGARLALQLAEQLLEVVNGSVVITIEQAVNSALRLGVELSEVIQWYDGTIERITIAEESAKEKSVRQSLIAKQKRVLSEGEWGEVAKFIERKTKDGLSVLQACTQAAAQLQCHSLPGVNRSVEISASRLRSLWYESKKVARK